MADISIDNDFVGRAGVPFKKVDGKPVYEINIENMPFESKEFDFVYCSHVLEHVDNPELACKELMRVAKRGYIETPKKAKDLWLNTAKISNHRWSVDAVNDVLTFSEYTEDEIEGLQNDLLMSMHTSPLTDREKAFSALIYIKADKVNTMFYWNNNFEYAVNRSNKKKIKNTANKNSSNNLEYHGSAYGGWNVAASQLNKDSIIYSFGVGEDISFDTSLIEKYGCNIFALILLQNQ